MAPTTIQWGILATGGIAQTFTKDLLVDPATRGVTDVKHTVVAAASSSGAPRARTFLSDVGAPSTARAYGTYEELAADPDVHVIYVSTPHSHHYQNVKLCLEAGKNVLCEKAFTVNAPQARDLVRIAREKNLFLMEALWIRYFPLSIWARDVIASGQLGTVTRAYADNSANLEPEKAFHPGHRMVSPDLAGGALLDMGIYSLTWIFQTLYHAAKQEQKGDGLPPPPGVVSSIQKYAPTGVDESVSMILTFPRDAAAGGDMHGIATTGYRVNSDADGKGTSGPAMRVQGTKGELQVWAPIWRPTRTRLVLADGSVQDKTWEVPGPGKGSGWFNGYGAQELAEGEAYGMHWEADEVGRALAGDGTVKEGKYLGLDESIVIMEVMDQVRKQNELVYPAAIEAVD